MQTDESSIKFRVPVRVVTLPSREEIVQGFHALYLNNISKASRGRGGSPMNGLTIDELKPVFNETIADYFEELLKEYTK